MTLFEEIVCKKEKISLIGLGYVGMPIAVAFSKVVDVIGFDVNAEKVAFYNRGIDRRMRLGTKRYLSVPFFLHPMKKN